MADVPEGLALDLNRDQRGLESRPWARRVAIALLAAVLALGLANVFGQRPSSAVAEAGAATLELSAPERVRSGLYWQARLDVEARDTLRDAAIVLDPGWLDGTTLNTVEPAPADEASDDGRIVLRLGPVDAGERHVLFLELQTNPTTTGRRDQDVELRDGDRLVARIDRTQTIWP